MDKAAKHTSAWADAATGQMHPARSHEVHGPGAFFFASWWALAC